MADEDNRVYRKRGKKAGRKQKHDPFVDYGIPLSKKKKQKSLRKQVRDGKRKRIRQNWWS